MDSWSGVNEGRVPGPTDPRQAPARTDAPAAHAIALLAHGVSCTPTVGVKGNKGGRTRKGRSLLPPLIALALFAITVPAHWADSRSLVASIQCVSDGDTIIAMTADGTKLRVRLLGIDAPEIPHGTKFGQRFGPLDTGDGER